MTQHDLPKDNRLYDFVMKGSDYNAKNYESLIRPLPKMFRDESGIEIIAFSHMLFTDGNVSTYFYDVEEKRVTARADGAQALLDRLPSSNRYYEQPYYLFLRDPLHSME